MARYHLARTTPVRLRDLSAPSATLSRGQWVIACAIDGTRSVQDLAWHCGLALCDAIECVGRLIQAGGCDWCARPAPAERAGSLAQWSGGNFAPAQPELLRRVLDGLRRLG